VLAVIKKRKLMKLLKGSIPIIMFLFFFNGLEVIAQEETEIDSVNLTKLIAFCEATLTDEILIVHNNKVATYWRSGQYDSVYFNTASMVKSWTGLVIGILIDKGLIKSGDDLVCQYIPEWKDGCKYKVTIINLLTMSAGLNKRISSQSILASEDMNQYAVNVKLDTLPNVRWNYSNESVQLLGIVIERVSGKSANEYFKEVLFDPLEMDSTKLHKAPNGHDVVYGGAMTTIHDAMKIGLLMLNNGKYKGKQIVSEKWIKKSITPSDFSNVYGYLWWLDYSSENKNYAAMGGYGHELTIVYPELDLVFLRHQSKDSEHKNRDWMGPNFIKLVASVVKKK
jgi:CubicO group peptidase (beta-lactamase class C family)